jgi:DNA-binding XRE family transcriptional regulator
MSPSAPSPASKAAAPAPGGTAWEPVVGAIGPKVRALRQERGLSLQQLAHVADVSAAAVHKVERGDMVPTITTLLKIAGALRTPIRHFVETGSNPEPLAVHTRCLEADPTGPGSTSISGSVSGSARYRPTGSVTRVAAGGRHKGQRRPGETLVVVVHGALAVTVADEAYTVAAGESLHFPTHVDHAWSNPGPAIAQAIWFSVVES